MKERNWREGEHLISCELQIGLDLWEARNVCSAVCVVVLVVVVVVVLGGVARQEAARERDAQRQQVHLRGASWRLGRRAARRQDGKTVRERESLYERERKAGGLWAKVWLRSGAK